MKTYAKTICVASLLIFCNLVNAQDSDTLEIQRNERGTILFAHFKANESSNRKMKNDTIFLKSVLKAKNEDSFRVMRESTDDLGITHKRFQQFYKGLKVENAEFLVHGRNGYIEVIQGDFQVISILKITPSFSEQQALIKALDFVNSKKYKWEDAELEKFAKRNSNNPNATFYPKGELVISKDYLKGSHVHKLSWKFTISSIEPNNEQLIYVDANNGDVINNVPLICDIDIPGTAQTKYSATQEIICDSLEGVIRLRENRNGVDIQTLNLQNTYNYGSAQDFTNSSKNWISGSWTTFNQDQWALDAHWAAEKNLDFWNEVFNRNSIDDNGLRVLSYVHAGSTWPNAQWVPGTNNNYMQFGDGNTTFKPLTQLDIFSHEYGHGITQFTAGLTPGYEESGALNEGFSDIWGACVEHWATSNKQTWLIGEEMFYSTSYSCLRDLQNPNNTTTQEGPHPDTYNGNYWSSSGEPHTNSTVLSHWFYLLSQGSSGTNDIGNTYIVYGVGIDVAQRIAHTLESSYLFSSANFTAAKNSSITAATYLYGANSFEVMQVKNAWYAVGIGTQPIQLTISGSTLVCSSPNKTFTLNNRPSGSTVRWYKSNNLIYVSGNTTDNYTVRASTTKGVGWVQPTIYFGSDSVVLQQYPVWVGAPTNATGHRIDYVNEYGLDPDTYCTEDSYAFYLNDDNIQYSNNFQNGLYTLYYDWIVDGYSETTDSYTYTVFTGFTEKATNLRVRMRNTCGSSSYYRYNYNVVECSSRWGFSLSPNPTEDLVQIDFFETDISGIKTPIIEQATSDCEFSIVLYDNLQRSLKTSKSFGERVTINVSDLKPGSYIVKINNCKKQLSQVLIIN